MNLQSTKGLIRASRLSLSLRIGPLTQQRGLTAALDLRPSILEFSLDFYGESSPRFR